MEDHKRGLEPTGVQRFFDENDLIVSKTDLKGRITYVNRTFIDISGYRESELLGQPHSLIRHPGMPRSIFKLLWDHISTGQEIFAYVNNLCKNGDHYWVLAHVTPTFDSNAQIVGYHSNRRVPSQDVLLSAIVPLYNQLLAEEALHRNAKDSMNRGFAMLQDVIRQKGMDYNEFIFSLIRPNL